MQDVPSTQLRFEKKYPPFLYEVEVFLVKDEVEVSYLTYNLLLRRYSICANRKSVGAGLLREFYLQCSLIKIFIFNVYHNNLCIFTFYKSTFGHSGRNTHFMPSDRNIRQIKANHLE